jgi:hypothetical protein
MALFVEYWTMDQVQRNGSTELLECSNKERRDGRGVQCSLGRLEIQIFQSENMKEKCHFDDLDVGARIMLTFTLKA